MNGLRIRQCQRSEVSHLVYRHYLKQWPAVVPLVLALERGGELLTAIVGVMVFGMPPRETFKRYSVAVAWELARLFIEDEEGKNTESFFIGQAVKWIRKNRPQVELLVSYADPGVGHTGVIYRAANWIADGHTEQQRRTGGPRQDYVVGKKRYTRRGAVPAGVTFALVKRPTKYRFIYWMHGHEGKRIEALRNQKPCGVEVDLIL